MKKNPVFFLFTLVIIISSCSKRDFLNPNPPEPRVIDSLSISQDSIYVNPSGYAPLAAQVDFFYPKAGSTYIRVRGKHGDTTDITHTFPGTGLKRSIIILGLYADYLNTVDIGVLNGAGDTLAAKTIQIQTDTLRSNLPTSIVADVNTPFSASGIYMVTNYSAITPRIPIVVDNYGDIRWCLDYTNHTELYNLNIQNELKRLRNGNFCFGDASTDAIYEIDPVGNIINKWDLLITPYKFHHDFDEMPNGNFIVSVSKDGSTSLSGQQTVEDYVIEVDRTSGSIIREWDLKESLDENRTTLYEEKVDWVHVNSVLYDSTDNSIIVSGRIQGVFKLTFDNHVKWILSPHKGWTKNRRGEILDNFLLTPLDHDGNVITDPEVVNGSKNAPDFQWTWFQHSSIKLPDGNYMFFDNGDSRNYDPSLPKYSRAVEYKIDPVNMTIQEIWSYGEERGVETFSSIVSSVQYLPEKDRVLFCPGYRVQNTNGFGGKIVEIDYKTKTVYSQLSLSAANSWGFHRAKKTTLYP